MKSGALWLVWCVGGRGVGFVFVCWWLEFNFKCAFFVWFTFLVFCGQYTPQCIGGKYFAEFHGLYVS